jgi:hypothetical protein
MVGESTENTVTWERLRWVEHMVETWLTIGCALVGGGSSPGIMVEEDHHWQSLVESLVEAVGPLVGKCVWLRWSANG